MVVVVVIGKIKPQDMQAFIIQCLSQARINWEGCGRKAVQLKIGDDLGGSLIVWMGWRPDGLLVRLPLLSFPAA